MSFDVPVALFVFNRPEATQRVLDVVRLVKPCHLLVIADGPRPERPGEVDLVEQVRSQFQRIDWDCCVQTHWADENMGCGSRISSGLDWVFSQVDRAIILEDDILPDPSFFHFCAEMLERYGNDERIHMVRGSNTLPTSSSIVEDSYYFSRVFNIWGWATWKRAWENYDIAMSDWSQYRDKAWLRQFISSERVVEIIFALFDDIYRGGVDSWEFQWAFSGWKNDAYAIAPKSNLVSNIGFDEMGTHMQDRSHPNANRAVVPMTFPLRHPATVTTFIDADGLEMKGSFPGCRGEGVTSIWERLFSFRRLAVPRQWRKVD